MKQASVGKIASNIFKVPEGSSASYQTWQQKFMGKRLRLGLWIAIAAYISFTILELSHLSLNPDNFRISWFLMYLSAQLSLSICFILLRSRWGRQHLNLIFLIFSWSVTLFPQILAALEGKAQINLIGWSLMFFGQATINPVRWRLHLISHLGVFAYYFGANGLLGLPIATPAVYYLYLFWVSVICSLSVYLYERLASAEFNARHQLEAAYQELSAEKERSEQLLLNILPESIAERLKQDKATIADSFAEVSVLFGDIVGFTELSTKMSPPELVELLNQIFSIFDRLAERHGLEKIKTIGDAYMVVAGLPINRTDHAEAIADMALDMLRELHQFNRRTGQAFHLRIGIATGPVVAGVIGIKKFIYDLWGDTVNIASRMESHGIPDRIQVTEATYKRLKDCYLLEKRGIIPVKGKGNMVTYLLTGKL